MFNHNVIVITCRGKTIKKLRGFTKRKVTGFVITCTEALKTYFKHYNKSI